VKEENVYFDAIGGISDHVHIAVSFYPPFEIDRWIGQMKGASSHEFGRSLEWQSGYGVVSCGTGDLEWAVSIFGIGRSIIGRDGPRSAGANSQRRLRALKRHGYAKTRKKGKKLKDVGRAFRLI
jgi:Transposase IS200 like